MATHPYEGPKVDRVEKIFNLARKHKNATQSPLLRLPPEIRQVIYEYALGTWEIFSRHRSNEAYFFVVGNSPVTRKAEGASKGSYRVGNVPATCRQLYAETRLLPFFLNEITIDAPWLASQERFAPLQDDRRDHINTIRIRSDMPTCVSKQRESLFEKCLGEMLQTLRSLNGLRRVIVLWQEGGYHIWEASRQDTLLAMIRDGLWNVEVRAEKTVLWW